MGLIDADKFKQQVAGMVISMHYPAKKAIEEEESREKEQL